MKQSLKVSLVAVALCLQPAVAEAPHEEDIAEADATLAAPKYGRVIWETSMNHQDGVALTLYARRVIQDYDIYGDWAFADEDPIIISEISPLVTRRSAELREADLAVIGGELKRDQETFDRVNGVALPEGDYVITEVKYTYEQQFSSGGGGFGLGGGSAFFGSNSTSYIGKASRRYCFTDSSYLFTVRPEQTSYIGKISLNLPRVNSTRRFKDFTPVDAVDTSSKSAYPALQSLERIGLERVQLDEYGRHCSATWNKREFDDPMPEVL